MSNNLVQIIRKKFRETLAKIRPQYNQPSFVEFLSKPVEESKEPLKEGSKIFQQFESIIDEKYREFQRTFQADEKKIIESLVKEPTEYIKNAQLKGDYVEFLLEYTTQYAVLRPGELREKLENGDQRPPYLWMEFQQKHLGKELIERLEKIRTDPQFQDYIKAKERWKEDMKSRQPPITGDKAIDNHLKYVEILPQVHRWIMKQLYMDFRHHNQANFFKFLEKDFTDQKQLAREKVQKQQIQRQQQMPQQNNPYEQSKQPSHYDPIKQQQPQMSSHQPAYDPMKQQQLGSQPNNPYESASIKQNPQQMHQYGAYDTNRNMQQQQQPSHYGSDNSKMHNQGMQNQYSTQGNPQQQYQQNSQYNQQQQQQNNSYDTGMMNKSQYESMKQYPQQQNMYDSANKGPQQMNAYDTSKQQQSMGGYDPSKQYQGHQMSQINTHASPQLAHGGHMNQNAMQQRGVVGPNANRNAKMMGAHLAGSQGQGAHNYQQQASNQHQNMASQQMHNPAQISAGQSPRTQPSPSIHQNTHSQQQMLAQQQQMHGSQGHMQHMQSAIPTSASPHQNANSHYSMNSSYNTHQNMSQMHQQGKMGLPSPNPNQSMSSHQSSTNMPHSSMMNQSQTSGHYGSQQSSMQGQSQGRQMAGQSQNPSQMGSNQMSGQYPSQMGREKIDSLNARQSLSQQSQYSNSDSLTPRQSLSQNQNQSQTQNMYQQSAEQQAARERAEAHARERERAQAEQQAARERAEAHARERAQAEQQAARERAEAQARERAEAQARERAEAQAQARAQAEQARERAEAQARERERAQAEAQAQARAQAEQARAQAEQARAQAEAEAQARLRAEAQAKAQAQSEAQAKEAAMKRAQQQQQAQQAAYNTQQEQRKFEPLKPKLIHKEKFDLAFNFDTDLNPFSDFGTGLNEVSEKFKHPYGNTRVIEDFERKVRDEEYVRDDSIAEIEQQAQAQKKRVKVNPSFEEELNLIPSASTSTSTKESQHISSMPASIPEVKQPVLKPVERELNELKMDPRVKVEERGSLSISPYIDTIFYRMNDGIISYHEKLVLKIFQDETKGVEIQEMANISDFMSEYNDTIFFALKDAKVKVLVETWLEFIDMCAQKANSKIQDLDDLFG